MAATRPDPKLTYAAIVIVLVMWTVNVTLDVIFKEGYEPSPFLHAAFMPVLMYLLGFKLGGEK